MIYIIKLCAYICLPVRGTPEVTYDKKMLKVFKISRAASGNLAKIMILNQARIDDGGRDNNTINNKMNLVKTRQST